MSKEHLYICEVDRTKICDLIDSTPYKARNIIETYKANEITTLTFDLPVVPNGKWKHIVNEKLVFYNNEYYIIKKPTFNHDEDGKLYVSVECKHLSDILANSIISTDEVVPMNIIDLMKMALLYNSDGVSQTGWTVGNVKVDKVIKRGLEAVEQSSFSILLTIAEKFGGIMIFDSVNMKVNVIPLENTERPDIDLRVSKNLKSVEISYDTSEMYTRLYCYGGTDDDGNEIDIMSVNPTGKPYIDNFEYFKKLGYTNEFINKHKQYFVRTNLWRDSAYFDAQDLYNDGVKQAAKVSVPIVNISVTALDTTAFGNANTLTNLKVGDCIRVYDEDLGLDTLCNVISRTKEHEQPHLLNIDVTNSVTYHDTLSQLFTSVNTMSVVGTGSGAGGGSISDWHGNISINDIKDLHLYYLSAEQIEAKYASIENLEANYITADEIKAKYIDATSIAAQYATIGSLNAIEAKIKDLDVDYIHGKLAEFEEAIATKLTAGEFEAYKATIEKLFASYATIEHLEAEYIKAKQIDANYAKIAELDVIRGNFETLKADLIEVEKIVADKASIKDLEAINATIETLTADFAKIEELVATKVDAEYVKAQIVEANTVITDDLKAIHAIVDVLEAKYATIGALDAEIIRVEELIAKKATIEELNAAVANIGELNALVANIESILSGSIGTGILQTIHLTADNMVVDDAVIKSAMIADLDVSKLKAGTISTNKFIIKSDDGGILVQGSTMQFKDKSNKVRLQVGQDAQGNFNFIVFGEDGTTAIYNENGITKDAIPSKVIVDDMVSDDANISGSKLERESLIDKINEDGSKTISSSKIWVDEEGQSLGASFKEVTTSLSTKVGQDEVDASIDGIKLGTVNMIRNAKTMDYDGYGIKGSLSTQSSLLTPDGKKLLTPNGENLIMDLYSDNGEIVITELPSIDSLSDTDKVFVDRNGSLAWGTIGDIVKLTSSKRIEMTLSDTNVVLKPNVLYVFPEMETLNYTLEQSTNNNIVNEYHFIFKSGATSTTLTNPTSVKVGNLYMMPNRIYEISIIENLLMYQSWEA